ncbi:MAG TPA: long chain acyl-CoA synthetase [Desulfobacteraceae bacterium]|nr:long-chain-fatty-acid--CoA ligase [bacterium BMS3Abin13]HDO31226.1 long chain acyl-CoA synthetase [Desulfobacteraceae bacterium]
MIKKPQRLLREGMLENAALHPEKTALVIQGESFTYGQLADGALRLASALVDHGVRRGDRVAIYMDNTWPCVLSTYGTLLAGAVFLLINPQTKQEKLRFILEDSEAAILISDSHLENIFIPAVNRAPAVRTVLVAGDIAQAGQEIATGVEALADILAHSPPLKEPVFTIPNDLAALIYTSGSTGTPKGVMQTHQSMVFAAWSLIEYLRLSEDDRIMLFLPLAFDYGLYQLLMTMKLGATLIVERSFAFPAVVYKRLIEQRATVFPGVPTIFSMLLETYKRKAISFPDIARVTNTAAALPVEYIPFLKKIFPNALIFKMYGLTECKRVSYLEPELLDSKPGSVGKAIPGTETFLLSPAGDAVGPETPGILHVRGPHIMAGYWRRPELSGQMLKAGDLPGERILCTHDWFKYDKDGFLYFVGRSDDIIKTRGEKVSPVEIENVLHGISGIKEAVVIGVPDATLGQAIHAFVVVAESAGLTDGKIKKICMSNLENFMIPQHVTLVDEMPQSPNGKIDKKKLLESGRA